MILLAGKNIFAAKITFRKKFRADKNAQRGCLNKRKLNKNMQ